MVKSTFSSYKCRYIYFGPRSKRSHKKDYTVAKPKESVCGGQLMISIDEADEKIKEYGYVNFEPTKNEKWSVYCLTDGTILKLKLIPLKFIKKDDDYAVSATAVMVSFSQSELKGEPSTTPLPITEAEKKGVLDKDKTNMTFDSIEEPWNEYKFTLDGTKVSIRTFATEISGTNKKDAYGDPIYLVTHQSIIQKHPAL